MLKAIYSRDFDQAEILRAKFGALEDLRNAHGPIPVLHHAVELAGIAQTGPFLPLLAPLAGDLLPGIEAAAKDLLAQNI